MIYARVPAEMHEAVALYADKNAVTITTAVKELLKRGLFGASIGEFTIRPQPPRRPTRMPHSTAAKAVVELIKVRNTP